MEYAYLKLVQEHNINVADLPEEAQIGIETIKQIERGVNLMKKNPKFNGVVNPKTIAKIKANDKWVVNEILEFIDGKERNDSDEVPNEAKEVIAEIKDDNKVAKDVVNEEQQNEEIVDMSNMTEGDKIDLELKKVLGSKKTTEISFHKLKEVAPVAYNIIFDTYDADGENGIRTSYYEAIETAKEVITINKIK